MNAKRPTSDRVFDLAFIVFWLVFVLYASDVFGFQTRERNAIAAKIGAVLVILLLPYSIARFLRDRDRVRDSWANGGRSDKKDDASTGG